MRFSLFGIVCCGLLDAIYAWLPPIIIQNYKMFNSDTGKEFQVKGVAYYPRPNAGELSSVNNYDFFTKDYTALWTADIKKFVALGVNTVRIYAVDPTLNHDDFMCALSNAGIYAFIGMSATCKGCAIDGHAAPPLCYPPEMYTRAQMIYNAFAVYDNVIGFSVGNENNYFGPESAPCVKALIRDVQTYAYSCVGNLRKVPIGLDNADIDIPGNGTRSDWAQFYNCHPQDQDNSRVDWIGWNPYVECDQNHTSYSDSVGFQKLVADFSAMQYSIPVIFGEYGCNIIHDPPIETFHQQRLWYQATWLFQSPMSDYFSGGCAFEYSAEISNIKVPYPFSEYDPQQYGLGYYSPVTCDHNTTACEYVPYPQFKYLADKYKAVTPSALTVTSFKPDPSRLTVPTCPTIFDVSAIPGTPKGVTKLACSNLKPVCGNTKPRGAAVNDPKVTDQNTATKKDNVADSTTPSTKGNTNSAEQQDLSFYIKGLLFLSVIVNHYLQFWL